jgi:hypothetical protein
MNKCISLTLTVLFFIVFQSCSQKEKKKTDNNLRSYCTIIFESNHKKIYVSDEYSYSEEWVKQKNGKYKDVQTELKFTNKEIDSLAKYAYRIINYPALAKTKMTCGAGENITIEISYCITSILCKYSSVPSWSTLSKDNKKLYDILNAKTTIPK